MRLISFVSPRSRKWNKNWKGADRLCSDTLFDMDQPGFSNYFICIRNSMFQTRKLPWRSRCFRKPMFIWRCSRDYFFPSFLNGWQTLESHRRWARLPSNLSMSQEQETWDLNSPPIRPGSLRPDPKHRSHSPAHWEWGCVHIGPVSQCHRDASLTAGQQNQGCWFPLQVARIWHSFPLLHFTTRTQNRMVHSQFPKKALVAHSL